MWTHDLDPVILRLWSLELRWYGLMYVIGVIIAGNIFNRLSRAGFLQLNKREIESFITSLVVGMFVGARLAYVFIYNWGYYQHHLSELLSVWRGGLSFHGAVVGMVVVMMIWSRKKGLPFYQLGDTLALGATLGLGFGRLGNFINGELYGRLTEGSWGIIFPGGGPYPRHPSQLYEAFFEGFLLFCLLWLGHKKVQRYGIISTAALVGYGMFRYGVEFFRAADPQLGYYFNATTTMGQILCAIMVLAGLVIYWHGKKLNYPVHRTA